MNLSASRHALALATLLALGAGAAHAVEFTDPRGDDKGPGNYVYPTDSVYKAGSFDIVKFKADKSGGNVDFSVDVAAGLEDPGGMGGGFATQMVFIFIKTGASGGHSDAPPGLNVTFAPGTETAATNSRFCWSVHTRRRSGPEITVI